MSEEKQEQGGSVFLLITHTDIQYNLPNEWLIYKKAIVQYIKDVKALSRLTVRFISDINECWSHDSVLYHSRVCAQTEHSIPAVTKRWRIRNE